MKANQYYNFIVSFSRPVEVIDEYITIDSILAKDEKILFKILKKEYLLKPEDVTIMSKELVELFNYSNSTRGVNPFRTLGSGN